MIYSSSCLLGLCVNYRGAAHSHPRLVELAGRGEVVCFCPEQAGGLPTPRVPSEIEQGATAAQVLAGAGRVVARDGTDVTAQFVRGAKLAVQLATLVQPEMIVLRNGSPSCGATRVYDGTFSGTCLAGEGITACALRRAGFAVVGDDEF